MKHTSVSYLAPIAQDSWNSWWSLEMGMEQTHVFICCFSLFIKEVFVNLLYLVHHSNLNTNIKFMHKRN